MFNNQGAYQVDAPAPWRGIVEAAKVIAPTEAMSVDAISVQAANARCFPRLTFKELMAMPPKQWLIDDVIGPGDLAMVYGAPGSGKTFVVIDLMLAACSGKAFAGRFEVARPLTIAYAAGEGRTGLPQRFQAACEYHEIGDSDLMNLHTYFNVPQLYDTKDPCNATQFVGEYAAAQTAGEVGPLDLLILDTLHSVSAGADENSSQDMGDVLRHAKAIADGLGCAVILVHHTNKAGTGERGSSALRGAMDCMIEVRGDLSPEKLYQWE
jgi:RecA-family ATPase